MAFKRSTYPLTIKVHAKNMSIIKNKRQNFFLENLYPSSTPTQSKGEFYSRLFGVYPPLPFQEIENYRSKEDDDENYQRLLFSNIGILKYFYFPLFVKKKFRSKLVKKIWMEERQKWMTLLYAKL